MKKGKKILSNHRNILFILVLATFMMGIGYASVNSVVLNVDGNVSALIKKEGLVITSVKYSGSDFADKDDSEIINAHNTMMTSKIVLPTNENATISYEITINNFTQEDYYFIDTVFYNDFYDNQNITFDITGLDYDYKLKRNTHITFEITFKYIDNVDFNAENFSNELNSYLNFRFLRKVKYIEGTGSQYIDTGVIPNNNTTFDMNFSITEFNKEGFALLGTRKAMGDLSYNMFFFNSSNKVDGDGDLEIRWDEGYEYRYIDLNYVPETKITASRTNTQFIVNTNGKHQAIDLDNGDLTFDSNIYLFNINQQDASETRYAKMKLFSLQIYQDGNIIRDFIPVLDDSGIPCLYDLVGNEYYHNELDGNFEYGYYETVSYIEGTGTQYIATGYYPNNLTTIDFTMSIEDDNTTQPVFGARTNQTDKTYNMFLYQNKLRWDYLYSTYYLSYLTSISTPNKYLIDNNTVSINEEAAFQYGVSTPTATGAPTDSNFTHENFRTEQSMYIFSINNGGAAFTPAAKMKLYYFNIKEGNTLVRNLVPAIDVNNVAGLYDAVNERIYYSATGAPHFNYSK